MTLSISLIHFDVRYKETKRNKEELLAQIREAAETGAKIIITPEMSVSGYSFTCRSDIAPYVEEEDGAFSRQLADLAEHFDCYICVGMALRHTTTDGYCNSALVCGPDGLRFRYDKVNGEIRWSLPGSPKQDGCFDTPWGRVGVLICSDTYYDLQPRISALKGADLLLVPANWPPSGENGLDPVEVWRARALENGMAVAACNRTGKDLLMDCKEAKSCLISSQGEILFQGASDETEIFDCKLPLTEGRFERRRKETMLSARKVEEYHSCYRTVNIVRDFGGFMQLPEAGKLAIHSFAASPKTATEPLVQFEAFCDQICAEMCPPNDSCNTSLFLLTLHNNCKKSLEMLANIAQKQRCFISVRTDHAPYGIHVFGPQGRLWEPNTDEGSESPGLFNVGPARTAVLSFEKLMQPENAVAISKDGCDLLIIDSATFTDETRLICGARTISHLCITTTNIEGAGIWMVPEGHARWGEVLQEEEGHCSFILDTALTRKKRFQDRVDFDMLLRRNF